MTLVSAAYLERKLRSILGMSGSNPIPDLATVAQFVQVEVDRPEWAFPGGERLAAGTHALAAGGAGTFGQEFIENPPGSGLLVIVEHVEAYCGATGASAYEVRIATSAALNAAGFTSFGERVHRDGRAAFSPAGLQLFPGALIRQVNAVALAGLVAWFVRKGAGGGVAGAPSLGPFPFILPPGTAVGIRNEDDASLTEFMASWRERPFEGGNIV